MISLIPALALISFFLSPSRAETDLISCQSGELRILTQTCQEDRAGLHRNGIGWRIAGQLESELASLGLLPKTAAGDQVVAFDLGDYGWPVLSRSVEGAQPRSLHFYYLMPVGRSPRATLEIWKIADPARQISQGVNLRRDAIVKTIHFEGCRRD